MTFTAGGSERPPAFFSRCAGSFDNETRAASVPTRRKNKNHEPDKDSSQFNSMTKLATKLKEEFFALLPPTIYFFVALHIVAFVRVLMLEKTGIAPSFSISIAVAALILG